jgi:hypothetical protein
VKLADIRVGEEYAVRLSYRRLAIEGLEIIGGVPYASGGYRARAVAIEKSAAGRSLVRVELTARVLRTKEAREESPDGTWTIWQGIVVDDHDVPVDDETSFELLVQSSQIVCEWTDAIVEQSVRSLDEDWELFDIASSFDL